MEKISSLILSIALYPHQAFAQANIFQELDKTGSKVYGSADAPQGNLYQIVGALLNVALSVLGIILLVIIIYSGFLWMTARGEKDQVGKAQKMLTQAIIGLVIILLSYALVNYVLIRLAKIFSAEQSL